MSVATTLVMRNFSSIVYVVPWNQIWTYYDTIKFVYNKILNRSRIAVSAFSDI